MAGPVVLFQTGIHASRPAASAGCVLYWCTTHTTVYVSNGSAWSTFQDLSGLAGAAGTLTTIEEVDGSPTDSAVTKLVFPNGTLGIASHVATYTPAAGSSFPTTAHADCSGNSAAMTADTAIDAPGVSVSLAAGTWDVVGAITFRASSGSAGYCLAALTDGSNTELYNSRGFLEVSTGSNYATVFIGGRVTPGSTTTYKLRGTAAHTNDIIRQYINGTAIGTWMTATKVA